VRTRREGYYVLYSSDPVRIAQLSEVVLRFVEAPMSLPRDHGLAF
jgi:hypothetical protein